MEAIKNLSVSAKVAILALVVVSIVIIIYLLTAESGPKYVGCFADKEQRAIAGTFTNSSFADCKNAAIKAGAKFFGIQYGDANTGVGQCFIGSNSSLADAQKYGPATNCVAMPGQNSVIPGAYMGSTWSNAVYTV